MRGGLKVVALVGHEKNVRCVAWSIDGNSLASTGDDRTVRLWDFAENKAIPGMRRPSRESLKPARNMASILDGQP